MTIHINSELKKKTYTNIEDLLFYIIQYIQENKLFLTLVMKFEF
jgi:hypothetical protein